MGTSPDDGHMHAVGRAAPERGQANWVRRRLAAPLTQCRSRCGPLGTAFKPCATTAPPGRDRTVDRPLPKRCVNRRTRPARGRGERVQGSSTDPDARAPPSGSIDSNPPRLARLTIAGGTTEPDRTKPPDQLRRPAQRSSQPLNPRLLRCEGDWGGFRRTVTDKNSRSEWVRGGIRTPMNDDARAMDARWKLACGEVVRVRYALMYRLRWTDSSRQRRSSLNNARALGLRSSAL